jgi:hypothetical protein
MKNPELVSDQDFGIAPDVSDSDLQREFVRPENTLQWKGHELWRICNGGEILFNSVIDVADSNMTCILIWIFIHLKRGFPLLNEKGEETGHRDATEPAEDFEHHLVALCWNKIRFRGEFLRWLDTLGNLTTEDKKAAVKIFDDEHGFSDKSAVMPVKTIGQKKTTAKPRSSSRSSSASSRPSRAATARQSATSSGTSRKPS